MSWHWLDLSLVTTHKSSCHPRLWWRNKDFPCKNKTFLLLHSMRGLTSNWPFINTPFIGIHTVFPNNALWLTVAAFLHIYLCVCVCVCAFRNNCTQHYFCYYTYSKWNYQRNNHHCTNYNSYYNWSATTICAYSGNFGSTVCPRTQWQEQPTI